VLEITKLNYCYKPGLFAVKDVSLTVTDGEFVALTGRNGSGKTTLTRLIMSLLKPTGGEIMLDGADTAKLKTADLARQIGYVFQNPDRQIFRDTVAREIAYGPEQLGFSPEDTVRATAEALAATGLEEMAQAYPRTLNKGQKQRLAIASALAMRPRCLILDEPTSGQDARGKRQLMELLAGLNVKGMTILLITHDMELLLSFARRVIVLAAGTKVFDGDAGEMFAGGCDINSWGLREPAVVKICQGLRSLNISPPELIGKFTGRAGERYA